MKFSEKVAKIVQDCTKFAREHGWAEYVYAPYVPLQVDEWRKKMETMKIEDRSDLRILADALCNVLRKNEEFHNCYLGIEGDNGVACEKCQLLAIKVAQEQERIREGLKKMDATLAKERGTENWCYGCKKVLPDDVEIEDDDHTESPWHRAAEGEHVSDRQQINGQTVNVCGPVFSRVKGEHALGIAVPTPPKPEYIDIVFDGPPAPEPPRFVEVENSEGASIEVGVWVQKPGGYWALRIRRDAGLRIRA